MMKPDIPLKEYHADKSHYSASQIIQFANNHGKFAAGLIRKRPQTESQLLGSVVHCLALEAYNFNKTYCVDTCLPKNTKEGREAAQDIINHAEQHNLEIISLKMYEQAFSMARAVAEDKTAGALLADTKREYSGYFECPETGLPLKFRPDAYKPGLVIDIKTAKDAGRYIKHMRPDIDYSSITPETDWAWGGFPEAIRTWRYHWQAWHYKRGIDTVEKQNHEFVWIVIETDPPFAVNCYHCQQWRLEKAEHEMIPVMRELKRYINKDFNVLEV